MKAIRWSIQILSLVALSLFLTLVNARADSNAVALINAGSGPISAYTGTGVVIGEIDVTAGVADSNHVYLQGQIIGTTNLFNGNSGSIDDHATQVAGVMVSTDVVTMGIAPGAKVYSVEANANNNTDQATNSINAALFLTTQPNLKVINMSESMPGTEFSAIGTSVWERAIDSLVSQTGVIFVQTPGNSGTLGAGSARVPGGTFNSLVVGSVKDVPFNVLTNLPQNQMISNFSPPGPLSDGRSKPDLVAPGGGVIMPTTNAPPATGGTMFATNSGTSFAAPAVAAGAARLVQFGGTFLNSNEVTDPRTIKAVLLNSATKLPGWQQNTGAATLNGSLNPGLNTVTQTLDPNQGAGLLNANGAYLQLAAGKKSPTLQQTGLITIKKPQVPVIGWDLNSVSLNLTNIYQLDEQVGGTMAITLDWYRDVGATVAGTNSILGLANLNLYLYSSVDGAYTNVPLVAQSISGVDNVEHLWFTNLPTAYYQFTVGYSGYSGGAAPGSVDYGLAWNFTVPEPSSLLLASLGMLTLWWQTKRRRRA
jgi:hypothetical protein